MMAAASTPFAIIKMSLRQALIPSVSSNAILFSAMLSRSRAAVLYPLFTRSTIGQLPFAIPLSIQFSLSSILSELWESILRAVPKKKTSHRKKRQRFLAGKALKDVTNLNTCSACGNVKRAHLLCPYCVAGRSCSCGDNEWCTHGV